MELHYYKAVRIETLPPYEEYDFAKGLAGYKRKLSIACVTVHGLKYLGFGTAEDVYIPGKSKPGKIVKASYGGNGDRF
ncbi:hypothetical protein [Desemzia sp. FAM 23990]|uniref:hypothetical protein n=1 Tax=Desemzia sp. FAM 23990 TaxID=3259520 RepID=UPI00388A1A74